MKSIKRGRGPSFMSGIIGIFMVGFGLLWTFLASQASPIMAIFGLLWTSIAVATTIYNYKNATSKKRYSEYDITNENEEPDPLNEKYGNNDSDYTVPNNTKNSYCPFCGTHVEDEFEFCNKCGKKLP